MKTNYLQTYQNEIISAKPLLRYNAKKFISLCYGARVDNINVPPEIEDSFYISGGIIPHILCKKIHRSDEYNNITHFSDIDIFFHKGTAKEREAIFKVFEKLSKDKHNMTDLYSQTSKRILYSRSPTAPSFDIIFREDPPPAGFDYVHCTPYYNFGTNELFISELAMESIVNLQLIQNPHYDKTRHRIGKTKRIEKLVARGWRI
tara:strand:+ start:4478 stop:5089 length:612 start_codon:yes stop_codon:yes gene_type:complete